MRTGSREHRALLADLSEPVRARMRQLRVEGDRDCSLVFHGGLFHGGVVRLNAWPPDTIALPRLIGELTLCYWTHLPFDRQSALALPSDEVQSLYVMIAEVNGGEPDTDGYAWECHYKAVYEIPVKYRISEWRMDGGGEGRRGEERDPADWWKS